MSEAPEKLVVLYQEMADLTAPECATSCRCPHTCCDDFACQMTKQYAKEKYGIALTQYPPNHRGAFYLGPSGCTVAPYLRPHCTMHTCDINGLGFKRGDRKWTQKYFSLRAKIEDMENQ